MAALAGGVDNHAALTAVFRFALLPIFLFSGTFFPIERLPDWLEPIAWATPLWHGVSLCRDLSTGDVEALPTLGHIAYLTAFTLVGSALAVRLISRKLLS
jgi:lipooligosaccharide transport system permease protein